MLENKLARLLWCVVGLSFVGFGALFGYHSRLRTWEDAAQSAACVALALLWGIVTGLRAGEGVRADLVTWAAGAEQELAVEAEAHRELVELLLEHVQDPQSLREAVHAHLYPPENN